MFISTDKLQSNKVTVLNTFRVPIVLKDYFSTTKYNIIIIIIIIIIITIIIRIRINFIQFQE